MEIYGCQIDENRLPAHVAIIMDGNGRWAKQRKRPRIFGHYTAMKAVRGTIRTASDMGIQVLTLYAFSTENWKRSKEEVSGLMNLAIDYFIKEVTNLDDHDVQVRVIGDQSILPERLQKAAANMVEQTKGNTGMALNIALNYGGREDILQAVRRIVAEGIAPEAITEQVFADHLYTAGLPDPDLVIRTSGEERLSNFLLWQNAYAEFIFDPVLWPDFDETLFCRLIAAYQQRDRRYGGIE
ncbi:isoprenyl transferase [Pseudoramibacter faecis]|uniref:isoprenyl transferase n=1 Tax=Pseudoramibacter faecis TaxID=3108534 RepID=UPI002E7A49F6|nr:isoprenyl transferase [Pseudoramibacter sp. HA2172]